MTNKIPKELRDLFQAIQGDLWADQRHPSPSLLAEATVTPESGATMRSVIAHKAACVQCQADTVGVLSVARAVVIQRSAFTKEWGVHFPLASVFRGGVRELN